MEGGTRYTALYSDVPNFRINLEIRILSGYFNKTIQCDLNFLFLGFEKFPAFSSCIVGSSVYLIMSF